MTSPALLIRRASRLLNDQEGGYSYVAWTAEQLLDYLNEALSTIYNLRPSEFARAMELTLRPGSKQEMPTKQGTILSIDSNIDPNATGAFDVGDPIKMSGSDMIRSFRGKASCADPCASFKIDNWYPHKLATHVFFVNPPVPAGGVVVVDATVSVPPAPVVLTGANDSESNPLGPEFDGAIVDWLVMRAMQQDNESQFAYNVAARHRASFYDAINGGYTADSRIRTESAMGQEANHKGSNSWRSDIRNFGR